METARLNEGGIMTFDGIVRNGMIVLDQGATLPEGTRVTVVADAQEAEGQPTHLSLLKLAGMAKDLPADFAAQHDHYIISTEHRSDEDGFCRFVLLLRAVERLRAWVTTRHRRAFHATPPKVLYVLARHASLLQKSCFRFRWQMND